MAGKPGKQWKITRRAKRLHPDPPNPRQPYKYYVGHGNTEREWLRDVERQHAAFVTAWEAQQQAKAAAPLLSVYAEAWLTGRVTTAGAIPETLVGYRNDIKRFIQAQGDLPLSDLTTARVQAALDALRAKGYAASTINETRARIKRLCEAARLDGLIPANPVAGTTLARNREAERVLPVAFTVEQVQALLAYAEAVDDPRWPMWTVLVSTGLRIGELLGIRWEDIRPEGPTLLVWEQISTKLGPPRAVPRLKHYAPRRLLPLTPMMARALAVQQQRQEQQARTVPGFANPDGLVFTGERGQPLNHGTVRAAWYRALAAAGLPQVIPHLMRKTAGTLMLQQGISETVVSRALGHANTHVTRSVYLLPSPEEMQAALIRLSGVLERGISRQEVAEDVAGNDGSRTGTGE